LGKKVPATNGWEAYKKNLKFGEIKLVLKKPKQVEKDKILTIRTAKKEICINLKDW